MVTVFLGLGSNLGESGDLIRSAFTELSRFFLNPRLSRFWRSRARYVENQPDFTNAAFMGETDLDPRSLLKAVNTIETAHGRNRQVELEKGPRSLDIDILLYGDRLIDESDLIIPHPGLWERKFALLPLLDLSPGLGDPVSGRPFSSIAAGLPAQGIYLMGAEGYDRIYT